MTIRRGRLRRTAERKINTESRAAAGLAIDLDKTTVVIDYAVNDGETQSGAFAAFLGSVERLKNVRLDPLADASAGIGNANKDVALGIDPTKRHAQLVAGGDTGRERDGAVV